MSNFLWHSGRLVQLAVRRADHHIQSKSKNTFFSIPEKNLECFENFGCLPDRCFIDGVHYN